MGESNFLGDAAASFKKFDEVQNKIFKPQQIEPPFGQLYLHSNWQLHPQTSKPDSQALTTMCHLPMPPKRINSMIHSFKLILLLPLLVGCLHKKQNTEKVVISKTDSIPKDISPNTDSGYVGKVADFVDPNLHAEEVYEYVDNNPSFPGGEAELLGYMGKNFKFDLPHCYDDEIHGKIHIEFIVEPSGKLSNITMTKGPKCHKKKIEDYVRSMPDWLPGTLNGKKVRVHYTLPIFVCYKDNRE